jgi:hypothetical protein
MKTALFCLVATLLIAPRLPAQTVQQDVEDRVQAAVREMEDENFHTREAGVKHMLELPPEALVYLDRIASDNTASPEVIARIQQNIERLRDKAREKSKLLRATKIAEWEAIQAATGYTAGQWRNAAWNPFVKDGFSRITSIYDGGNPDSWRLYPPAVFEPFQKAVDAGCEDPLVNAFYLRTGFKTGRLSADAAHDVLPRIFPRILKSPYADALKIQAILDFTYAAKVADPAGQLWTATERWGALESAAELWPAVVKDPAVPDIVLEELAGRFLEAGADADVGQVKVVGMLLDPWRAARPNTAAVWAFKAAGCVKSANTMIRSEQEKSEEELRSLKERIATAREAGEKAYAADVTEEWAPTLMILVCQHDDADANEMETWFHRAMAADPDNFDACANKLRYLAAHGEVEEAVKFGRACAAGERWQGRVPLALIAAHEIAAENLDGPARLAYLQSPDVWADYQQVFTRFLSVHPKGALAIYYRSLYAEWACVAEKWTVARDQFHILGDRPDVSAFTSMSTYNYLRRKADRLAEKQ